MYRGNFKYNETLGEVMELVKEKEIKINLTDLQQILDYLQKQPYNEVHELIHKIIILANKE